MRPIFRAWDMTKGKMIPPERLKDQGFSIVAGGSGFWKHGSGQYALNLIPQMYIERGDIDNVRIFEGDVVYVYGWNTGTAEDAIDGYIHYNSSKAHWVVRAELFEIPVALLKREQIKVVGHKFQKEDWRI